MSKIAIDCDGVLANFLKAYEKVSDKLYPNAIEKREPTSWEDLRGLTPEQDNSVWKAIRETPNFWMGLDAFSNNVAALAVFMYWQKHNDIYIVTSRAPSAGGTLAFQTDMWLRACGVVPGNNYLGTIVVDHWHDKRKLYKVMGIEFSVDDKKETVEDCDTLEGHTAFLLDREWNTDAVVKNRIPDLNAYFSAIKGAQSRG